MFIVTGLVACFFSVACSVGYEEAWGILIALALLFWAIRCRRSGLFLAIRIPVALLGLGLLWMMAVDRSWIREVCVDCDLDRDVGQYRVFRIPIYERVLHQYNTEYCRIAEDLGMPCSHRFQRWQMTRWWGLFYPARPSFCGTLRLSGGPDFYDEDMAKIVRAKARASPGLAEEFHRKAILERDSAYRRAFLQDLIRLKASRTGR